MGVAIYRTGDMSKFAEAFMWARSWASIDDLRVDAMRIISGNY